MRNDSCFRLFYCTVLIVGCMLESGIAAPSPADSLSDPQIKHLPVTTGIADEALPITARLTTAGKNLTYFRIYYRTGTQGAFRFLDMRPEGEQYRGQIPANHVRSPSLQYFLIALFENQTIISMPAINPYGKPFEVRIGENNPLRTPVREDANSGNSSPNDNGNTKGMPSPAQQPGEKTSPKWITPQNLEKLRQREPLRAQIREEDDLIEGMLTDGRNGESNIIILSPDPFSQISADEALIAAAFNESAAIDPTSVQVYLNRRNVTPRVESSDYLVSFNPGSLPPGRYRVAIVAKNLRGERLEPVTWRFTVLGKQREDTGIATNASTGFSGIVFGESRHEKYSGLPLDYNYVGGNVRGGNGKVTYGATAFITSLESTAFQPRNRVQIYFATKPLEVTLGDANPYFNNLVLWGRRVRGIEAHGHLGFLHLGVVTGQSVRAVDPLAGVRAGTFKQSLFGIRPAFGGKSFQIGLTMMKARDDTTSINTLSASTTPRDNLVFGADFLMSLFGKRFELRASTAHSWLTNDTRKPIISRDSIKANYDVDLPFDPASLRNYIIINESTTPLDPRGGTGLAYHFEVRMRLLNQAINAGLKQVGSQYRSFGHTYLRNGVRSIYFNDQFQLFRNRVFANAGIERALNNFQTTDSKPETNLNTFHFGVTVNWAPGYPALSMNYRNYNRANDIDSLSILALNSPFPDTTDLRENTRSRDFFLTVSQDLRALGLNHTISLSFTNSSRLDRWRTTRVAGRISGDIDSALRMFTLRSKYRIPLTTSISFATNDNNVGNNQSTFEYRLLNGMAEYNWLARGLRAYFGIRSVNASGGNQIPGSTSITVIDYSQLGFELGGVLQIAKRHELQLDLALIDYNDNGGVLNGLIFTANPSFTNKLLRLRYEYRI